MSGFTPYDVWKTRTPEVIECEGCSALLSVAGEECPACGYDNGDGIDESNIDEWDMEAERDDRD